MNDKTIYQIFAGVVVYILYFIAPLFRPDDYFWNNGGFIIIVFGLILIFGVPIIIITDIILRKIFSYTDRDVKKFNQSPTAKIIQETWNAIASQGFNVFITTIIIVIIIPDFIDSYQSTPYVFPITYLVVAFMIGLARTYIKPIEEYNKNKK